MPASCECLRIMPQLGRVGITFLLVIGLVVSGVQASSAGDETVIHYAPFENLERIDVGLLDQTGETIDMAAYILTDRPVIDALIAAKERGVAVRLLLDPSQKTDLVRLEPLKDDIRFKKRGPIMHLKSYLVDGERLRTGSANFTASGLKQQDNDLVVTGDRVLVERFKVNYELMWGRNR